MVTTTNPSPVLARGSRPVSIGTAPLQRLPAWLSRLPLVVHWMWLSIRHGSVTLPSSVNPGITAGGLIGEARFEYLNVMGPQARANVAPTAWVLSGGPESADEAEHAMRCNALFYPIVMKPDIGARGHGVRRVDNRIEMLAYLKQFPRGERIVMQALVDDAGEAGLYYVRRPDEARGRITGLLLRHLPRVSGDGESTVSELIEGDAWLLAAGTGGASELSGDLNAVPLPGDEVRVATVGSRRAGGLCEDGSHLISPAMNEAFDQLALDMQDFHVGCFGIKFESMAALKAGRGFKIIDVDGASADEAQAWNPALSLREAYRILFRKQRLLFAIGDMMRRRGHAPIGLGLLLRHALNQHTLVKLYPPSN